MGSSCMTGVLEEYDFCVRANAQLSPKRAAENCVQSYPSALIRQNK